MPSLSVELRSLTVAKIDERPFFRTCDQFLADGILQDVIRLLAAAFVVSQPMFEEVALPHDAEILGCPFLPFPDDQCQWLA